VRNIEEIYQDLLTAFAERAGFVPEEGCDLAVRLWAAAAQLQSLGVQADWVLEQSFPQTAQGQYLDYHGQMRGLTRMPALKAVGVLRFWVDTPPAADMTVPKGTVCMTEKGVRFQTTEEVVLKAGDLHADTPAEALEGGAQGNAAVGMVAILTALPVAVTGCTNPEPFSGGRDSEADESFRRRILDSYQRLPNGANAAWYEQTAVNYGGVAAAKAIGRARGIGTVDVYVATAQGVPGEDLLAGLQAELQEKREIAVDVAMKSPNVQTVDIAMEIAAGAGLPFAEVKAEAERVVTAYFGGELLGKAVCLAELGSRIYALPGVENYRFITPEADLAAGETVLPVLGTLSVTEMEA
jgi:uncharacterized phage protein gp47/JayE